MLYKVVIGDYSDDGHGKTYTALYEIPDSVTKDQLNENFARNVEKFVNPYSFANHYEDSTIDSDEAEKLVAAGFEEIEWGDQAYMTHYGMAELVVWLATHNFTTYKEVKDEVTELVGWNGILKNPDPNPTTSFVGYGCFY